MQRAQIEAITIRGFKSIQALVDFRPRSINVFIGQNGAGKSNFVSFYKFLSNMLSGTGNLANYVGMHGGASVFLFDGAETTPQLTANIALQTAVGLNEYKFKLAHAAGDTFVYTEEYFRYTNNAISGTPNWYNFGAGHKESIRSLP